MGKEIIHTIKQFIIEEKLFPPKSHLLVACSGGPDSIAAVAILLKLDYKIAVAHCNFKLRGEESEVDQQFVEKFANSHHLPFHSIDFDTKEYADDNKLSIQETARILRYEWLEGVRKEFKYHFIITAHHKDDAVETVLMHIAKGCGIKGLTGIPIKNVKIVRPLLCLGKEDLFEYLKQNAIEYRIDASNTSNKYTRNFIRNKVIPQLLEVNPLAVQHIYSLSKKATEAEVLMQERLTQIKKKITFLRYDAIEVKLGYILTHSAGATILYEMVKTFGFNSEQSAQIYQNLDGPSGNVFLSSTHKIIKERRSLFIIPLTIEKEYINQYEKLPNQIIFNNYKIQIDTGPTNKIVLKKGENYAFFDLETIEFPLTIRYWKAGDYFYPFGLTKPNSDKIGKKKLSKYFKDQKISVYDKENTPVLFSGEKLIWLVGHRIDDRFKVTEKTKIVLKFKVVGHKI